MVQQHSNGNTPGYIKALLAPNRSAKGSRRAWGIDVEGVWVPFYTATNVMQETAIPDEVLGAPIRLAKDRDGEVRFSTSGRPVMRVHPELNAQINLARENFVAGLQSFTGGVMEERPDAYREAVEAQQAAAKAIFEAEAKDIAAAEEKLRAQAQAEATPAAGEARPVPEAPKPTPAHTRSRNNTPADGNTPAS
jgi:hypothetical protein